MKQTILLVDDVRLNLEILKKLLDENYNIICTYTGNEAIEIVKSQKIDLILLDIMMPGLDGYEVCSILQSNPKTQNIPIIFVTARLDEESIVKGYDMGAVDYVTKPYKKRELLAKIKTHLKIKNLIEDLEYIATHDTMTGSLNRRQFFTLAMDRFKNKKDTLFAVMMDIDKFKNINDTYGHHIGDIVIKKFAEIVKSYIEEDTIFGRLGGEEFGLICNFNDENKVKKRIEVIRKAIERNLIEFDNQTIKFTVSLGIAKANNFHHTIDDVLKEADEYLYEAKGSGRNKVIFRKRVTK